MDKVNQLIAAIAAYREASRPLFIVQKHGAQRMPTAVDYARFYTARDALDAAIEAARPVNGDNNGKH